jgi:hypothetical protein
VHDGLDNHHDEHRPDSRPRRGSRCASDLARARHRREIRPQACGVATSGQTFASVDMTVILVLLFVSAAAELFGTVTVSITYARGHRLAQELLTQTGPQVRQFTAAEIFKPADTTLQTWKLEGSVDDIRRRVANQLRGRWWITAGLIAYGVGALAAGLLALYR